MSDEFYNFATGKFGGNAPRDMPGSSAHYFNQRLLECNQYFESDADFIFFARSVYEQDHSRLSINFAIHKIKPVTLKQEQLKIISREQLKSLLEVIIYFLFMSSVKETPEYWKQFILDVLAIVKQL